MLDKTFKPAEIEPRIYAAWEAAGVFAATPAAAARPFTLMMPPPNVTGSLHIGHALTFSLQDILVRYQRAQGRDVLWQPGADHAGIATQMVVERQLEARGETRAGLGRDAFIAEVWRWKAESGGAITQQLRRLGASPDWARERFTLDDGMSRAVRRVFVQLHREGLIYKDERLVNWDPKLKTAISDLEVEQRTVAGSLWYIRYPIEGEPPPEQGGRTITVATTRPETLLGDTGVAVHPDDARYRDLVGRNAVLPLVGRVIPIVADAASDPEKGSGAVKITPAHDPNDFEVGRRHGLAAIAILDDAGRISGPAPAHYAALDRFAARKRIVADLDALGLIEKVEPISHSVPHGDRSGVVIEPRLTWQWYCNAQVLAQPAIRAVESGQIRFVPQQWENTYFAWMRDIQPWCISRQLWWGHQIPAWYGPDGAVFVAEDEAGAHAQAIAAYGAAAPLTRDPDVLDTWFSSALFPFSTLGWPDATPELARYYPTDLLVTGFDIIFFWVARMMMMGLHIMGDAPFREVYIHALVRDARGQKMSKSKGNVVDPLELIERYGVDALRFTFAASATPGRDVKLSEPRIEGYRNFTTKLWNAARFAELNDCRFDPAFDPAGAKLTINRWIIGAVGALQPKLVAAFEAYRLDDAANLLYRFVWGDYCDWYLEFAKPALTGDDRAARDETRAAVAWALGRILRLMHPLTPFVTEELWAAFGFAPGELLARQVWPEPTVAIDAAATAEIEWVVELIGRLRGFRSFFRVPEAARIKIGISQFEGNHEQHFDDNAPSILRLARIESYEKQRPRAEALIVQAPGIELYVELGDIINLAEEKKRIDQEIDHCSVEIKRLDAKLGNADFRAKADPAVIEETEDKRAEAVAARERLAAALARLAS